MIFAAKKSQKCPLSARFIYFNSTSITTSITLVIFCHVAILTPSAQILTKWETWPRTVKTDGEKHPKETTPRSDGHLYVGTVVMSLPWKQQCCTGNKVDFGSVYLIFKYSTRSCRWSAPSKCAIYRNEERAEEATCTKFTGSNEGGRMVKRGRLMDNLDVILFVSYHINS